MLGSRVISLICFISALSNHSAAQQQLFTTYAVNDGLVHNYIKDFYQDSKGFIWIGTWEGLSKYDGYRFTNYTTVNGLSHGVVNDFYETKEGIYVFCNDGSIDIIKNNQRLLPLHSNGYVINSAYSLSNKKIIAATDKNGICEFENGKILKPNQFAPKRNYYAFARLNDSLFVAQSDTAIDILNYRYELISEYEDSWPIFSESGILTDSKQRTWIGTRKGLKLLSPIQQKGKPILFLPLPAEFDLVVLNQNWIQDIMEDNVGNMWFATSAGLIKIGIDGSQQTITKKDGLPADDVARIFQDREKNIWAGGSKGVAKLVTNTTIRTFTKENGLLADNIRMMLPLQDGNILVATTKGTQLFDKRKGTFVITANNINYESNSGSGNNLSSMIDNKSGIRYLVFPSNSSNRVPFSPSSSGMFFALRDRRGNFFYPSNDGLLFSHDLANWKKSLFYAACHALLLDSNDDLWIGLRDGGLVRMQYSYINDTPKVNKETTYLPGIAIRSLYEDSKGYIWVGSRYNGLFRIDPAKNDTSSTLHFDQSTGLTSNRIVLIAEDTAGCIWLDFFQGLDKLIPSENSYRVFNFSRFNNFFTNIQHLVFDKDHSMWVATTEGLVNISDGKMENIKPLNVYITTASLGDSVYYNNPGKAVSLSYRHKQVQFEFAAAGFINEKQVLFSYRLAGSNNTEWSQPSNEHAVSYANLQPGNYRFEVRNKGWNGEWGNITSFEFVILPPFWQTWWFALLASMIAAFIIFILIKRRIAQVRKEGDLKQQITEIEMSALRAQMNPHFIFNCISAIDNLIQTNQKDKATKYLTRFAKLIRIVLDSSKNNLVPFHKDYESLQLFLQLEQFRCNNKFEYEFYADAEIMNSDIKVPPLIAQPFVENAIHHGLINKPGPGRKLIIEARLEKDFLKYTIEDNGIGRRKAEALRMMNRTEHSSYGIEISKKRIDLHNHNETHPGVVITDLENGTGPAGTKVELWLSVK